MKTILTISIILLTHPIIFGQQIIGKIIDAKTNKPLEYVSIGVINTKFGTITDSTGYFKFHPKLEEQSIIRISMIGYEPLKFEAKKLVNRENEIKLARTIFELPEIVIKPTTERKVGPQKASLSSGWSGWGGQRTRKGYEMGIILDLGQELVQVKNLNVLLKRQSFNKSLFRLHIREINETLIGEELLTENIILPITKETGWVEIDLTSYNINLNGKVGVTLEWLEVIENNPERAMKISKRLADAYFLFKNSKNHIGLYRWGVESNWITQKKHSPCIYLTILE